jgi:hypothetical protein
LAEPYRAAVYYAPERDDPLWRRGCAWLGRDPESGEALVQPELAGLAEQTSDPRRYGFHATLKPPMRLTGSFAALLEDAATLAAEMRRFALPALRVAQLGRFIALVLPPCPPLRALADACVTRLDSHRAPETPAEQEKRAEGRSAPQREMIARWGYPYVLNEWQFHMTLSNGLGKNELAPAAAAYFGTALSIPRRVESLAIFAQAAPDAPFQLVRRLPLAP